MKQFFYIKEISDMYNIGIDSLRYYEKIGLLHPKRGDNGYRIYTLSDIYKLNLISDLKNFDLSMKQIKEYLDEQDIQHTKKFLDNELDHIEEKIDELKRKQALLKQRKRNLEQYSVIDTASIVCKEIKERRCVRLKARLVTEEESDYAMKRLHLLYEQVLNQLLDQQVGSVIHMNELSNHKNMNTIYSSIFFIVEDHIQTYDFVLPEGMYLSIFFKGEYQQSSIKVKELLSYAEKNNYIVLKEPLELCHIDNRHTQNSNEFVTEIQIYVKKKNKDES